MSLESTILQIHQEGFIILNLFELGNGTWQANLYDGEKAWDFGVDHDPEVALLTALDHAKKRPGVNLIDKISPDDLLDALFN